jgi:hypothetical protein
MRTRLAALLLLAAAFSLGATSQDLADQTLGDTLRAADAIAWVRILDKTPVTFESEGRTQTCGYNYSVKVVEKIKGEGGVLSFFSDHDQAADHAGSDYFVVVFLHGPDAPAVDGASGAGRGREREACMEHANPRFVRGSYPGMMIPREEELSTKWGATLFRRDASNLLWSDEFRHRDFQDGDRMHSAASWEQINEAFERAER